MTSTSSGLRWPLASPASPGQPPPPANPVEAALKAPPEDLQCPLCAQMFLSAVLTPCCGRPSCRNCAEMQLERGGGRCWMLDCRERVAPLGGLIDAHRINDRVAGLLRQVQVTNKDKIDEVGRQIKREAVSAAEEGSSVEALGQVAGPAIIKPEAPAQPPVQQVFDVSDTDSDDYAPHPLSPPASPAAEEKKLEVKAVGAARVESIKEAAPATPPTLLTVTKSACSVCSDAAATHEEEKCPELKYKACERCYMIGHLAKNCDGGPRPRAIPPPAAEPTAEANVSVETEDGELVEEGQAAAEEETKSTVTVKFQSHQAQVMEHFQRVCGQDHLEKVLERMQAVADKREKASATGEKDVTQKRKRTKKRHDKVKKTRKKKIKKREPSSSTSSSRSSSSSSSDSDTSSSSTSEEKPRRRKSSHKKEKKKKVNRKKRAASRPAPKKWRRSPSASSTSSSTSSSSESTSSSSEDDRKKRRRTKKAARKRKRVGSAIARPRPSLSEGQMASKTTAEPTALEERIREMSGDKDDAKNGGGKSRDARRDSSSGPNRGPSLTPRRNSTHQEDNGCAEEFSSGKRRGRKSRDHLEKATCISSSGTSREVSPAKDLANRGGSNQLVGGTPGGHRSSHASTPYSPTDSPFAATDEPAADVAKKRLSLESLAAARKKLIAHVSSRIAKRDLLMSPRYSPSAMHESAGLNGTCQSDSGSQTTAAANSGNESSFQNSKISFALGRKAKKGGTMFIPTQVLKKPAKP